MYKKEGILVIDDEEAMRDACLKVLTKDGYDVMLASEGISGIEIVNDKRPDMVIVDLKMPKMSGMEVLEKVRDIDPSIISVVITGYATVSSAVDSMKKGAYDFLPKPFTPDELRIIVKRGLEKRRLALEADALREERERMKKNFITFVSHQLKSPLVSVQQYFEAILSKAAGEINLQQEKIFRRINSRISELLALIDNWLSLSRIEKGRLVDKFSNVSLLSVLAEVVETMRPLAMKKKVSLIIEFPDYDCVMKGDKESLKQLFMNLVDNGIKYNLENGRVVVRIIESPPHFVVEVCDTGIGISEDSIPFIFDEFFRGETGGSGLGLSITKKIIDAHSGFIKVESIEGKGSRFRVFLPK